MDAARSLPVDIDPELIAEFCRKHHIAKLSLFGSVLRDDFTPESDVDMLVEFEQGHVPGLIRYVGMELELGDMIGRKVDLRTKNELSDYFRDEVIASAFPLYVS